MRKNRYLNKKNHILPIHFQNLIHYYMYSNMYLFLLKLVLINDVKITSENQFSLNNFSLTNIFEIKPGLN